MRIAIVEDSAEQRAALTEMVERYCREAGLGAELLPFESGDAFLAALPQPLDIALLDIEMAGTDGMQTARRLRERDRQAQIIFVTYLLQYAIEGYAVDAVDFIVKPAAYPALRSGLDRAVERAAWFTPRFLMTSYAREPVNVQLQQITFIESLNKRTIIHTAEGEALYSSEPLYALEEKLAGEAFFRCHNAYLVNLRHVRTVSADTAAVPGQRIPVSKYRKRAFLQRLAAFRGRLL